MMRNYVDSLTFRLLLKTFLLSFGEFAHIKFVRANSNHNNTSFVRQFTSLNMFKHIELQ